MEVPNTVVLLSQLCPGTPTFIYTQINAHTHTSTHPLVLAISQNSTYLQKMLDCRTVVVGFTPHTFITESGWLTTFAKQNSILRKEYARTFGFPSHNTLLPFSEYFLHIAQLLKSQLFPICFVVEVCYVHMFS